MDDRELLELAAKAIGMTLRYNYLGGRDANQPWDPLTDDGDALRLAVKLGIGLLPKAEGVRACTAICASGFGWDIYDEQPTDSYAAIRRAIVRAAAEIGKVMP